MNKIKFVNGKEIEAKNVSESASVDGRSLRFTAGLNEDFEEIVAALRTQGNLQGIEVLNEENVSVMNTGSTYADGDFSVDRNVISGACSVCLHSKKVGEDLCG